MKILHTSDLHLISPVSKEGEHRLAVLEEICRTAESYDALIIAGDLFDSAAEAPSLEKRLRTIFTSIMPTPVLIIPGNHDFLRGENPFSGAFDFGQDRNVRIFTSTPFEIFSIKQVNFYGFPFQKSKTTTELFRELDLKNSIETKVAIMHGTPADRPELAGYAFQSDNREEGGELLIKNRDLRLAGFNYTALGHIHRSDTWPIGNQTVSCCGSPTAVRSTETEHRSVNSVFIDLESGKASVEKVFLKTALRSERRHFFVFPGEEKTLFARVDAFIEESRGYARPCAVIEGIGDTAKVREAKSLIADKWNKVLPAGLDFKIRIEKADDPGLDMIMYGFLRKMQALSEAADTPQSRENLSRCMRLGWRALNNQPIEPADILENIK